MSDSLCFDLECLPSFSTLAGASIDFGTVDTVPLNVTSCEVGQRCVRSQQVGTPLGTAIYLRCFDIACCHHLFYRNGRKVPYTRVLSNIKPLQAPDWLSSFHKGMRLCWIRNAGIRNGQSTTPLPQVLYFRC